MNRNFLTAPITSIPVTAVAILSLAAGLSACTSDTDTDALIGVLPDDRVLVNLNTDNVDQAARGDLGDWSDAYLQTASATDTVNGMIGSVLDLVHTLTDLRPSSYDRRNHVAIWGPFSDTLDPAETTLTVQYDPSSDMYTWWFTQWPKGDESAATTVVAGEVDPGATHDASSGRFVVDFTAIAEFDPTADSTGIFTSEYDIATDGGAASASFQDWVDLNDPSDPIDAYYVYDELADGSGSMDLAWQHDYLDDGTLDIYVLRSRWDATGAGRGDAVLADAEGEELLGAASECWNTSFKLVYGASTWEAPTGDSDQCVYSEAAWPE